jgi:hypothetical protein
LARINTAARAEVFNAIRSTARIGVRPWACPQSRAAHHGYDWCALPGGSGLFAVGADQHGGTRGGVQRDSIDGADRRAAVGLPAEPGGAPRLRLVRPAGRRRGGVQVMVLDDTGA